MTIENILKDILRSPYTPIVLAEAGLYIAKLIGYQSLKRAVAITCENGELDKEQKAGLRDFRIISILPSPLDGLALVGYLRYHAALHGKDDTSISEVLHLIDEKKR